MLIALHHFKTQTDIAKTGQFASYLFSLLELGEELRQNLNDRLLVN